MSRGSFRPRRGIHLGGGPGVPKPFVLSGGGVRGQQGLEAVTGHWLAFLVSLVVGGQIGDFSVLLLWTVFLNCRVTCRRLGIKRRAEAWL